MGRISLRRLVAHSRPLIDYTIKLSPIPSNIILPHFVDKRSKAKHLVSYVLKQKKQSISHVDLFLVSLKIYKDPFTALGVIGHMLDNERLYTADRRTTLLASKMQDLLLNHKEDPVGYNYHFWAYLNISITNNGNNLLEKGFSLIFQKWIQDDLGDYSADLLGIKTGELVHRHLNKSKSLLRVD